MSNHYVSAESKYKDNLDSAISLLIVGILGIAVIVLINLNVINLNLQSTTKLLMTVSMGLLFLMFVIFGIKSIITSKKFKSNISTEANTLEEIRTYLIENIDIKNVDSNLDISDDTTDEELYIYRTNYMTELLVSQFPDANESFINEIIDTTYDELIKGSSN